MKGRQEDSTNKTHSAFWHILFIIQIYLCSNILSLFFLLKHNRKKVSYMFPASLQFSWWSMKRWCMMFTDLTLINIWRKKGRFQMSWILLLLTDRLDSDTLIGTQYIMKRQYFLHLNARVCLFEVVIFISTSNFSSASLMSLRSRLHKSKF